MQLTSRTRLFVLGYLLIFWSSHIAARQQDGPPRVVRQAVDATVQFLRSDGRPALEAFAKNWLPRSTVDPDTLYNELADLRKQAKGKFDDLMVEAETDGVRLILQGGTGSLEIRLKLDAQGILAIESGNRDAISTETREQAVKAHMRAFERAADRPIAQLEELFDRQHWSASLMKQTTPEQRRDWLKAVQRVTQSLDGALFSEENGQYALELSGATRIRILFRVEDEKPYGIRALEIRDAAPEIADIEVSPEQLPEILKQLADADISGVISIGGQWPDDVELAFGDRNPEMGLPMEMNSVFCIGSTPIDFTVAAIHLLASQGKLSLDDQISKYFPGVPEDKSAITLRHLLTGRSGLPNFHHVESDEDPDLTWIDREEAERRILSQSLLFAPGEDEAHSHSAFGLLAAVVERVSGTDYASFLSTHLFEPAGMQRTGMYGEARGIALSDFAVGGGPSRVGSPNIPPHWGKTSWLVMGSGGMYSTLGDLKRFYAWARNSGIESLSRQFSGEGVGIGGSDRGYYVLHVYSGSEREAFLLVNADGRQPLVRSLTRGLERVIFERE